MPTLPDPGENEFFQQLLKLFRSHKAQTEFDTGRFHRKLGHVYKTMETEKQIRNQELGQVNANTAETAHWFISVSETQQFQVVPMLKAITQHLGVPPYAVPEPEPELQPDEFLEDPEADTRPF